MLAGAPAIVGIWLGSLTHAPHWSCARNRAGAILQAVIEIGWYLVRNAGRQGSARLTPSTRGGLVVGIGVMYTTAMLVKV